MVRVLRITEHPILRFEHGPLVRFTFDGREFEGVEGEAIAAALHAAGVRVLSHSHGLHRTRGFYCAIGNCSSCLMMVNGEPNVRVCVEKLTRGDAGRDPVRQRTAADAGRRLHRRPLDSRLLDGGPVVSGLDGRDSVGAPREVQVVVVGAGPAGLCAALSAASLGAQVVLLDRESRPGGQLIKQTHMFFGSREQYAGTRGIDIARILYDQVLNTAGVEVLLDATVLGRYPDSVVTVEHADRCLKLKPERLIVATGASEKVLPFPNNDLPGIYGAGAVQTLMNVHGVRPGNRVLMVGAGNIGLIVSYQLLQAGVAVAGIIEAAPTIGGYLVHASKVRRSGVPILTSHTIKEAYGDPALEGVVVWRLDERWQPVPGTERDISVDVVCVAVGLSPLAETPVPGRLRDEVRGGTRGARSRARR